jgi:hypothetical protein
VRTEVPGGPLAGEGPEVSSTWAAELDERLAKAKAAEAHPPEPEVQPPSPGAVGT